jgi:TrmH family RNA methyltransferase
MRAADAGITPETVFACPELYLGGNEPALVERLLEAGAEVVEVTEQPFRKASYRDRPEGLLAIAPHFPVGLDRVPLEGTPLVLVAEAIEKPGNLGTMLRTAEASGADGVIASDPTTDVFNPNVVRASLGTLFQVPLAVGGTPEVADHLRRAGVRTLATSPEGDTPLWEADMTGPTALVVGSEQYGLSGEWLGSADDVVTIPMPGSVDSMNAAMAAGILLFEAVRQRRA